MKIRNSYFVHFFVFFLLEQLVIIPSSLILSIPYQYIISRLSLRAQRPPMKRKSEFMPSSQLISHKNKDSQTKPKSKNIPSEIWLKRNILKKLTLQLKFNKSSTHQYRKFRQILIDPQLHCQKQPEYIPNTILKQKQTQIISPSKQKEMSKLSTLRDDKSVKYTGNFFASNAFSKNGMKSYHHKSSICQGNNFINVSKVIILSKNHSQKLKNPKSNHKRSLSQNRIVRQTPYQKKQQFQHKRPFSAHQSNRSQDLSKKTDFLKVSTKQLHLSSIDAFLMDCTRQNRQFFDRKSKAESRPLQIVQNQRQRGTDMKPKKFLMTRPKSCFAKTNRTIELTNCQGWVTVTAKNPRQEEEPFFNIIQF